MKEFQSDLSHKKFPVSEKISGKSLRISILKLIQSEHAEFTADRYLAVSELHYYQEKYMANLLSEQIGELTQLEKSVLTSITNRETLADKIDEKEIKLSFGQNLADKVATFGGSWTFIISFGIFILLWVSLNVFWLINKGFDPYPFILLNLILSCLAALQAPVIMMSQNRQEEKDRERAKNDYMINLKSELEVRVLNDKIDHLMLHQQQELLEIQKVQIEMMNDIFKRLSKSPNS